MSSLADLVEAIDLHSSATTWPDAIARAGALLENTGAIDPAYTQAMISSVEENGPYIVVAPGFAFAHARPSAAVHRTAVAWTRLDQPVSFGHDKNDPVSLVVALAAKDDHAHTAAMKDISRLLARKRAELDAARTPEELRAVLGPRSSRGLILTVCGNGLGTSLFLKNTLDSVLDMWGWGGLVTTEATDTISAKGRAQEADFLLTSAEIAKTLGEVSRPVIVIDDFTSAAEVDAALRTLYDLSEL